MPVAAAIAPIASSAIGGIAGIFNKRPPSLDPTQQAALDSTLKSDQATANAPATIDPTLQASAYDANARSLTGANAQVDHALASRGLAGSGVEGAALQNNAAQSSANQVGINSNLQNQAIQQKNFAQQMIAQLTKVPNIPGQSAAGALTAGAAGPLAYSLQQAALNQTGNQVPSTSGVVANNQNLINSGVYGNVPAITPPDDTDTN